MREVGLGAGIEVGKAGSCFSEVMLPLIVPEKPHLKGTVSPSDHGQSMWVKGVELEAWLLVRFVALLAVW